MSHQCIFLITYAYNVIVLCLQNALNNFPRLFMSNSTENNSHVIFGLCSSEYANIYKDRKYKHGRKPTETMLGNYVED